MKKFFGFLKKGKAKEQSFCSPINFDSFPVEVHRNYDFDSGSSLGTCQNALNFDCERKLKNDVNHLEGDVNSHFKHAALDLNIPDAQCVSSEKSSKTMYAITMTNCKYFHIGIQKTINVTSNEHLKKSWSLEENVKILLDSCERISETSIMVISLHIGSNWKKFGTCLGLNRNYLEQLNYRTDMNAMVLSFDMLQKYLTLFPNTTIGFIVNVLNEIQQEKIIKEIAKNIIM